MNIYSVLYIIKFVMMRYIAKVYVWFFKLFIYVYENHAKKNFVYLNN